MNSIPLTLYKTDRLILNYYFLKIYSIYWLGKYLKLNVKKLSFKLGCLVICSSLWAQLSGIRTVCAAACDFTTLKGVGGAFADVNDCGY